MRLYWCLPLRHSFRNCLWTLYVLCALCVSGFALDRNAFTFTHYDLRAQVIPATHSFAASGAVTLRNDSAVPQKVASLQISSSLAWNSIRIAGNRVGYLTQIYTSDIDHTGAVSEAIVTLPREVPPGGTVELQIGYNGEIERDATRLTRIGVPPQIATRNDWDEISDTFTAVRGVGHVCWYPVAMDSGSLSEGNSLFEMLGEWKARHAASSMRLTLTVSSSDSITTNGVVVAQRAVAPKTPESTETHEGQYEFFPMGRRPPTFVVAPFAELSRPTINVSYLPNHKPIAQDYIVAAEKDLPFLTDWFGAPHEKVRIIELADADAVPFDSGAVLFTPLRSESANSLELIVAHQIVHASIRSSRPWISEGLAHFAQALTREQQDGRKAALAYLDTYRPALVAAEKQALAAGTGSEPGTTLPGQPLVRATDEIFYRTKAMFVWWMLRDMVGDQALRRAVRAYHADEDREPSYVQRLVEAQSKRQLEWFFDDWVYRDRGLPDFRITAAYARTMLPKNVSVTVTVENLGAAGAEVPVLVPVAGGAASRRILVRAGSKAVDRIEAPQPPSEVIVNDGSVPESDVNNNVFKLPKQGNGS